MQVTAERCSQHACVQSCSVFRVPITTVRCPLAQSETEATWHHNRDISSVLDFTTQALGDSQLYALHAQTRGRWPIGRKWRHKSALGLHWSRVGNKKPVAFGRILTHSVRQDGSLGR